MAWSLLRWLACEVGIADPGSAAQQLHLLFPGHIRQPMVRPVQGAAIHQFLLRRYAPARTSDDLP
jgi:hypothetical protein